MVQAIRLPGPRCSPPAPLDLYSWPAVVASGFVLFVLLLLLRPALRACGCPKSPHELQDDVQVGLRGRRTPCGCACAATAGQEPLVRLGDQVSSTRGLPICLPSPLACCPLKPCSRVARVARYAFGPSQLTPVNLLSVTLLPRAVGGKGSGNDSCNCFCLLLDLGLEVCWNQHLALAFQQHGFSLSAFFPL